MDAGTRVSPSPRRVPEGRAAQARKPADSWQTLSPGQGLHWPGTVLTFHRQHCGSRKLCTPPHLLLGEGQEGAAVKAPCGPRKGTPGCGPRMEGGHIPANLTQGPPRASGGEGPMCSPPVRGGRAFPLLHSQREASGLHSLLGKIYTALSLSAHNARCPEDKTPVFPQLQTRRRRPSCRRGPPGT